MIAFLLAIADGYVSVALFQTRAKNCKMNQTVWCKTLVNVSGLRLIVCSLSVIVMYDQTQILP